MILRNLVHYVLTFCRMLTIDLIPKNWFRILRKTITKTLPLASWQCFVDKNEYRIEQQPKIYFCVWAMKIECRQIYRAEGKYWYWECISYNINIIFHELIPAIISAYNCYIISISGTACRHRYPLFETLWPPKKFINIIISAQTHLTDGVAYHSCIFSFVWFRRMKMTFSIPFPGSIPAGEKGGWKEGREGTRWIEKANESGTQD